jgi:hypothetical protein
MIIVEGREDCYFVKEILKKIKLVEDFQVVIAGDKDRIFDVVTGFVEERDKIFQENVTNSFCIICDADKSASDTFTSLCGLLDSVGLTRPTEPFQVVGTNPKVAIIILPDGKRNGELEDLCVDSLSDNEQLICVKKFYDSLNGISKSKKPGQSILQIWRALQDDPKGLGAAIKDGQIKLNDTFNPIIDCITKLHG